MMVVGCPFGRLRTGKLLPGEGMTGQDRHFDKVLLLREGQVRAIGDDRSHDIQG